MPARKEMFSRTLLEYYRCPERYADFEVSENLSSVPGFFCLGPDTICYGKIAHATPSETPTGNLPDSLAFVSQNRTVSLPFNLDEIVTNLRAESYSAHTRPHIARRRMNRISWAAYYRMRPHLPVAVRKHLQKAHLSSRATPAVPRWPVDTTVDDIMAKMLGVSIRCRGERAPFVWFWPDGATFCATMTHDVETAAGRDFCSRLMDINESFGIRSSFQVIPERRYPVPEDFLSGIRERGFEVNVHDLTHDGHLFRNREEFLRRAQAINSYCRKFRALGFRSGVLYRNQDWLDALTCEYDMSVPNSAHFDPQHGGCCTVMPFFIGRILEVPVTVIQDYTLFHILHEYSIDLWQSQLQRIAKRHGVANFIVHPDYIIDQREQSVYLRLLEHLNTLRSEGLWLALPREINEWWRARQLMKVVYRDGRWQIEGPQSNRARLAFAELHGDELRYEMCEQSIQCRK